MQVWELGPGRLMVAGAFSDLAVHHHPAVQITVGGRGPLTVTKDWAAGSPKPRAKQRARCESASPWVQDRRAKGEPVNLSGLAISHSAQTFPSRTVIAMIRGRISRYPSLAGRPAV